MRADVLGRAAEHGFKRTDDLVGAVGRLSLLVEEPPRVENHRGIGPEGGGVGVVRVAACKLGHRVAVGDPEPGLVGREVGGESFSERFEVGALVRGAFGGEPKSLLHGLVRGLHALGRDGGLVVVWPERERESPVRHRHARVELGGTAKRARGLVVVEPVDEYHALVEEPLRLGDGGSDGHVELAQSFEQTDVGGRRGRPVLVLRGSQAAGEEQRKRAQGKLHRALSSGRGYGS